MKLPAPIRRFDQIAQEHGWTKDLIETEEDTTFARVYSLPPFSNGDTIFSFVIGFGLNPNTNRWVMLETVNNEAFLGVLFEDEYPIMEWGWKQRSHLNYWLSHPRELLETGIDIPDKVRRQIAAVIAKGKDT